MNTLRHLLILLCSFVLLIVPFALDHSTLLAQQVAAQDKSLQQLQRISTLPPKESVEELNAVEASVTPKWKALFHYLRGAAASNIGNLPLALKDINAAYNLGSRTPDLFFARAVILLNSGFPERAVPDYTEALRQKHTNPGLVHYGRSIAFTALKRWADALKDLDKTIALKYKTPDVYRQRGDTHTNLGNYALAVSDYTESLHLQPNNAQTHYNRAVAFGKSNQWDKTIEDFSALIRLSPQPRYYLMRGGVLASLQMHTEAVNDLTTFLATPEQQDRDKAFCLRAYSAYQAQSLQQTLQDCDSCLARNALDGLLTTSIGDNASPVAGVGNPFIYTIKALSLSERGDSLQAHEHFLHAAYLKPEPRLDSLAQAYKPQMAYRATPFAFPSALQLYPRNARDSAVVPVQGVITAQGWDSVYVRVLKNGKPYSRFSAPLRYTPITTPTTPTTPTTSGSVSQEAAFAFAPTIHAELSEYTVQLGIVRAANGAVRDSVLTTRDSIICGDVFVLTGQSNAIMGVGTTLRNEFCRTYQHGYIDAWGVALARFDAGKHLVGGFGLNLQHRLVSEAKVPIALLNGAQSGTFIEKHLPAADRTNPTTLYGSLLTNARRSGLDKAVKGLIWYQGEWNSDSNYAENFRALHTAWHQDFPNLKRVYVMQIRPHGVGERHGALRDLQRRLPESFPDVRVFASAAVAGHDGSHFTAEGYARLAELFAPVMLRDFYGGRDSAGIDAPNIARARWSNASHTELRLDFAPAGGALRVGEPMPGEGGKLWSLAEAFALDGRFGEVSAVVSEGTSLRLTLKSSSKARTVSYVPEKRYPSRAGEATGIYEGPWLYNVRGVGALTFWQVAIEEY